MPDRDQYIAALEQEIADLRTGWHPAMPPEISRRAGLLRALAEALRNGKEQKRVVYMTHPPITPTYFPQLVIELPEVDTEIPEQPTPTGKE